VGGVSGTQQLQMALGAFKGLGKAIEKRLGHELGPEGEIGEMLQARGKEIVQAVVYDVYSPRKYGRTYRTLDAVAVRKAETGVGCDLGIFDSENLQADPRDWGTNSEETDKAWETEEHDPYWDQFIYPVLMLRGFKSYWVGGKETLPRDFLEEWFVEFGSPQGQLVQMAGEYVDWACREEMER